LSVLLNAADLFHHFNYFISYFLGKLYIFDEAEKRVNCTKMEVQSPPRSVQINFNNKIITLHNVTIVKNPKIITIDAKHYSNLLKSSPNGKLLNGTTKLQLPSLVPVKTLSGVSPQKFSFKVNQPIPVIKEVPKVSPTNVVTAAIQPPKNGIVQFKPSSIVPSTTANSPIKLQAFPHKPTVIISPPKANTASTITQSPSSNLPQVKLQLKPKFVISTNSIKPPPTAAPTKVIVSPPQKNKISPCVVAQPEAKRPCKQLDFQCIFSGCKEVFDTSNLLVDHMKLRHAESVRLPKAPSAECKEKESNEKRAVTPTPDPIVEPKVEEPKSPLITPKLEDLSSEDSSNEEDESEVNDLIMDLEDTTTQDTAEPESPEFEKHVPESPSFEQHLAMIKEEPKSAAEEEDDDDYPDCHDYEDFEYYSSIMEPICELSCEEDLYEGVQGENEAMRLYREAMEVNYQQNGIKKRGRRKQRKPKSPLVENMTTLNGILAGLLENASIKVPPGPGRGRRKEMNEQELEIERSSGVCLFSCNKCDLTFKFAGDLAKHVRSHTISSPYQCTICQRKFTHIGSLNTHLRIHSGERPYKCNQCNKQFTQSNSLMVHVKSHLSNKPFQCELCNKGFLNASSLALHQKTHTGPLLTVICPIEECKKEFRDNNLLEEHLQTHQQSMLYQCSLCSEKFEQSCVLVQHVKLHIGDKPFQVIICRSYLSLRVFFNISLSFSVICVQKALLNLARSTLISEFTLEVKNNNFKISRNISFKISFISEKPFTCEFPNCGKSFTQASSLSVHMKVHGEKEFKCIIDNCKKSFGQEAYLKKHMLKHIEASLNDENKMKQ
jgi:uncharacterized Zn-finger protein